ncbi:hypothetical protein KP509_30G020200 [Ceratopteris richardii]|uniref:Uncharacterized protein n=1 Tax=Ceratopteris richardii TaxID=49495 RepID=A0A8T2R278_CERRI|nr:hypothetical protein KP509_30G020200 [Ceratopteris richardii]
MVSLSFNFLCSTVFSYLRSTQCGAFHSRVCDESSCTSFSPLELVPTSIIKKLRSVNKSCQCRADLVNLALLCQTTDMVIDMQASAKEALYRLQTAGCAGTSAKMVAHLKETHILTLDVCRFLKDALSTAHLYVKALRLAFKRLESLSLDCEGDIERAKHVLLSARRRMHEATVRNGKGQADLRSRTIRIATKKLRSCCSILQNVNCWPSASEERGSCSSSIASLYGSEIYTIFFLRLLSVFLSSSRCSSGLTCSNSNFIHIHGKTLRSGKPRSDLESLSHSLDQISKKLQVARSSYQARIDVQQLVHSASQVAEENDKCMSKLHHQLDSVSSNLVQLQSILLGL